MLALLLVAYLAGVSAFLGSGSGVCFVLPSSDFNGVDTTPQNPNLGTFSVQTQNMTTTYRGDDILTITIASNGTDEIVGVMVSFLDAGLHWVGEWSNDNNYTQVAWPSCQFTGFTNTPYWNLAQSEVSLQWSLSAPEVYLPSWKDTVDSITLNFQYPYSGIVYWILVIHSWPFEYPTTEQIKAGQSANGSFVRFGGNFTYTTAELSKDIIVDGLEAGQVYTVYAFVDIIDPPTLSFQAYILAGNSSSHQLYQTTAGEPGNLVITPATNPLPSPVGMSQQATSPKPRMGSGAYTVGPAMLLIAMCQWISSSQLFL